MLVRLNEGVRAGDVVDMPYHVAAPLLASGRVTLPEEESAAEAKAPAAAERPAPKKRKG